MIRLVLLALPLLIAAGSVRAEGVDAPEALSATAIPRFITADPTDVLGPWWAQATRPADSVAQPAPRRDATQDGESVP